MRWYTYQLLWCLCRITRNWYVLCSSFRVEFSDRLQSGQKGQVPWLTSSLSLCLPWVIFRKFLHRASILSVITRDYLLPLHQPDVVVYITEMPRTSSCCCWGLLCSVRWAWAPADWHCLSAVTSWGYTHPHHSLLLYQPVSVEPRQLPSKLTSSHYSTFGLHPAVRTTSKVNGELQNWGVATIAWPYARSNNNIRVFYDR